MSTFSGGPGSGKGKVKEHPSKGAGSNQDAQDRTSKDDFNKALAGGAQGLFVWLALLFFYPMDLKQGTHEITIQELLKDYLVKGLVDKLEVVNRSVCLAHVQGDMRIFTGATDGRPLRVSVQLDTLKKFEEKVEQVQMQLGLQTRDFVPVQYVQYSDYASRVLLSVIVMIPYLLASRF